MKSQRVKTWQILSVLGAVIIFVATWFLIASPIIASNGEVSDQIASVKQQNTVQQAKVNSLASLSSVDKLKIQVNASAMDASIPSTLQDSVFLAQLAEVQRNSHAVLTSISIDSINTAVVGSTTSYPVVIMGTGNKTEMLNFIKDLQNSGRLMVVTNVSLQQSAGGTYNFTINGNIFQMGIS